MSSASPLPMPPQPTSTQPSAEKKVYEPSMEEILASIRRIIADDQSLPGRGGQSDTFASPLSPLPQEPAPAAQAEEPRKPEPAATMTPAAHGPVAAPQFAMPHPVAARARPAAEPAHAVPPAAAAPSYAAPVDPAPTPVEAPAPEAYVAPVELQPHRPIPEADEPLARDATDESIVEHVAAFVVDEQVVHLDEAALYDAPIAPPEAEADPVEALHAADLPPEPVSKAEPVAPVGDGSAGLFSAATDSSVASAFNLLAASRLADNSDELMNLAREMIRPLLRTWIDDNLPSMVERMVRAEIERVARGGR